ncbi:MAG: EAL domain-containing protein [Actinomycetota bacterium]
MEFLARGRRRRTDTNGGGRPDPDQSPAPPPPGRPAPPNPDDTGAPAPPPGVAPGADGGPDRPATVEIVTWDEAVRRWDATSPQRGRGAVAILIDHLDDVEEDRGPTAAARLLTEVEHRLLPAVRSEDLLVRLDGRGFLLLANDVLTTRDLRLVADRIHTAAGRPADAGRLAERPVPETDLIARAAGWHVTTSIGIAASFDKRPDTEVLAGRALAAARSSARHGGGHTAVTSAEDERPRSPWEAVQELHRAFADDELDVVFQPMVSLTTGRIEAVEALARWQHPERGLLYPASFLPDLTRAGLDDRLTDFVLDRASAESARLGERWKRTVPVAVNVDHTRRSPDELVEAVTDAANRRGLPLEALVVELSEERLTASGETGTAADGWPSLPLSHLVNAGLSVGVDGGSGDAESIGTFAPIRSLRWYKLDHTWLEPHRQPGLAGVARVTRKQLGPTVPLAALGIGDEARREIATDAFIDWGQGWALHKPIEAEELYDDEVSWVR